jgi:CysZ protein
MTISPLAAAAGCVLDAAGDVFSKRLRGLVGLCLVLAAALLALATWALIRFAIPLIALPWPWAATGLEWLASAGAIVLALVLLPAVGMVIAGVLLDVAAERVERALPEGPAGRALTPNEGAAAGLRIASLALPLNILALPMLFVPVLNIIGFLALNTWLAGREYFSLASLRLRGWQESRGLRRRHWPAVTLAGFAIAAWMMVPVLNLTTPLFAIAVMVRLNRRLTM